LTAYVKRPDKKNALSIVEASEREMEYTMKLLVSKDSAFNIIRNIYECFRMLGDARLVSKGLESKGHDEQIKELSLVPAITERPIKVIDTLKRIRNNINYYGYIPSEAEAEDAISIAKACFYQLSRKIKRELS
jgi:hypothetical protein